MEAPRLVAVGKIVKTHGIRGAVKVFAYGGTLRAVVPGESLVVRGPATAKDETLTPTEVKSQGRMLLMRFEGILDMDQAQGLVGLEILLPENRLEPLEKGEYYHYQLIGLQVVTTQGKWVGTLQAILETGSHDVYVVGREGGEALVPAVEDIVVEIDLAGHRMVIDPPEGLIDDL